MRHELWGEETFVDFEQGLNYCIRQIRTVLGDEAQNPRYVETIPRRGYRFITAVGTVETSKDTAEIPGKPLTLPRRSGRATIIETASAAYAG